MSYLENPLNVPRSYHGAEIPYVFSSFAARDWPWEPLDKALSEDVSSYWTNFAAKGDPNDDRLPRWPQFDPDQPTVMFLGVKNGVGTIPNRERLELWDAFYARQPKSLAEHLARR